jgi:L-histidine Nalpha-methyltransferase
MASASIGDVMSGQVSRSQPRPRMLDAGLAAEVRDALSRRQRELPARFLADDDAAPARRLLEQRAAERLHAVEAPLVRQWATDWFPDQPVRRVVELLPTGTSDIDEVLEAPAVRGGVIRYVAVHDAPPPAAEAVARIRALHPEVEASPLVAEPSVAIPLSRAALTVFTLLGGGLGQFSPVGAIRTLRAIRVIMAGPDQLLVGIDLRAGAELEREAMECADVRLQLHRHALVVANRELGADFDLDRFRYQAQFDPSARRLDVGMAALTACRVTTPIMDPITLRAGELVRTSVRYAYDRPTLASMLRGVGLTLEHWFAHPGGAHAIGVASTRVPEVEA